MCFTVRILSSVLTKAMQKTVRRDCIRLPCQGCTRVRRRKVRCVTPSRFPRRKTSASEIQLHNENDINIHKAVVEGHRAVHTHDFIEMGFVMEGKGTHSVNGQSYHIEKGDLFILNPNISHELTSDKCFPITVYNCIFQSSLINGFFSTNQDFADVASRYLFHSLKQSEEPKEYIRLTNPNTREIKVLLDEIYKEYEQKSKGFMQMIRADLTKLLILVFRLYRSDKSQNQSQSLFRKLVVKNTLAFMEQNYQSNITCGQLAERNYLSASYFSRIFREETGYPIIQMLQQIRVDAAKRLLEKTVFTIDEIAARVGYSDLKHFYTVFQKTSGCRPGEYRSMVRK